MIVLATDFGLEGPYLGQVRAVLATQSPSSTVIDLFSDLPPFDPQSAAYLLPAYCRSPFGPGTVFLCVVDPGVGTDRAPLVVQADGMWFVGPDNGLFSQIVRRASAVSVWRTDWRPASLTPSFHGRDLFAPVAAALASGGVPGAPASDTPQLAASPVLPSSLIGATWPDQRAAVCYLDRYGNAMTGLDAAKTDPKAGLAVSGQRLKRVKTFADVPPGTPLCYINSNGLLEIAVNGGRAAEILNLAPGVPVEIVP